MIEKTYLGDAVYAEYDDYGDLTLTTEDGIRVTNRIVLEEQVWTALVEYRVAFLQHLKGSRPVTASEE